MNGYYDIHTHHNTFDDMESLRSYRLGAEPIVPCGRFSAGLHPWDIETLSTSCDGLITELETIDCSAIGEIGLDRVCGIDMAAQREVFIRQLEIAKRRDMPVIIHCVKAQDEIVKIIAKCNFSGTVIFHGFIGSPTQAERLCRKGYYLSFGRCALRSPKTTLSLLHCPTDRLLLESDMSTYPIEELYQAVADCRGLEVEQLKEIVKTNYNLIFQ